MARFGDEGAANLASERRLDRDVLQVRVAAAQAAGCRDRLIEAGMYAPGLGVDELRQGVDVGALQLLQRAPFEDQAREIVGERQLLEDLDRRRRRPGLDVAPEGRQLELVEQNLR